jgi:hypothetical protein
MTMAVTARFLLFRLIVVVTRVAVFSFCYAILFMRAKVLGLGKQWRLFCRRSSSCLIAVILVICLVCVVYSGGLDDAVPE